MYFFRSETVRKPAHAERYRIETLAQAERSAREAQADAEAKVARRCGLAEAESIRAKGEAEAEAIRQTGLAKAEGLRAKLLAEAEGMEQKAAAWKNDSSAALGEMLIDKLPEVAASVAAPLANVDQIVLLDRGGDGGTGLERVTRGVTDVMTQVPTMLEAMTGVDLQALIGASPPRETTEGSRGDLSGGDRGTPISPLLPSIDGTAGRPPEAPLDCSHAQSDGGA